MTSLVFMFPGQTSRYPEMIAKITATNEHSARIVAEASEVLKRNLSAQYHPDNPNIFARNRDVQIGVFLANHLHMKLLEDAGVQAGFSLGLSLGEYNHLVHIGALSFVDALILLEQRGQLYEQGPDGVMVSVFPIEAEMVEEKIATLGLGDKVVIGLYNSPRQQVLSGERASVNELIMALEDDTFIQAVETEPKIPMHAPAFAPVAEKFRTVLDSMAFQPPILDYLPNVAGAPRPQATAQTIREQLAAHVCKPVRWQASIDNLASRLQEAHFIEVGPRAILYNLFGKGWMPGKRSRTDAQENWPEHMQALIGELGNGA